MVIETLEELRNGAALEELDQALRKVVDAVRTTGKMGKVSLTLHIKAAQMGERVATVIIEDRVQIALPEPERGDTFLFATPGGGLSRRDPRQPELPGMTDPAKVVRMNPEANQTAGK